MWGMRARSLGGKDPLEKEMAPHSSILAREIQWSANGELIQWWAKILGVARVGHDLATK